MFYDLHTRLKVNNFSINRQIPAYTSYFDVAEFQIKCVNELDIYDVIIDKYTEQKKLNNISIFPGPLAIMVALHLFCMALMILFILYCGMAFHSMMIAFSNILKRVERMMIALNSSV